MCRTTPQDHLARGVNGIIILLWGRHITTDCIVGSKFEGKWMKPGEGPIFLVSVSG